MRQLQLADRYLIIEQVKESNLNLSKKICSHVLPIPYSASQVR